MISVNNCRRKKCKELLKVTSTSASEHKTEYFCGNIPLRSLKECPREYNECRACNPLCDGNCDECLKENEEWETHANN